MKMEKLKIAIDNTSQNSSRTFGEILSGAKIDKKIMSANRDTWWFESLQNIKENQVYKYEYVFRHNPSQKFLLCELDSSIIVEKGLNLNFYLLENFSDTYSKKDINRCASQIVTLLATYFLDKERYLKLKSLTAPEHRDLVQRAVEFGDEESNEELFRWVCLSLFMGCEGMGKELDDTTLTVTDIIENTKEETKNLVGKDWKKNPIVKEQNLTKKQLIDILKLGRLEKQWS
jgi:hypothetical protein